MDDLEFKRHLRDLAHGHHHPEEHDWGERGAKAVKAAKKNTPVVAKAATPVRKRSTKRSRKPA